ncbi:hypothetical protein KC19_2G068100 [Ceratodon purpureus]|uniref:Uncharacterized protein n=1 Tax=Ceratodon purpureus TaxID=3225 RepID=A0A8T0ISV2_CERPU|nr:hypothetical protein KC19_2G068100 [Ceratodon purpureus]
MLNLPCNLTSNLPCKQADPKQGDWWISLHSVDSMRVGMFGGQPCCARSWSHSFTISSVGVQWSCRTDSLLYIQLLLRALARRQSPYGLAELVREQH